MMIRYPQEVVSWVATALRRLHQSSGSNNRRIETESQAMWWIPGLWHASHGLNTQQVTARYPETETLTQVYELTVRLMEVRQQLDIAEEVETSAHETLGMHRQRLVTLVQKHEEMIRYWKSISKEGTTKNVDILKEQMDGLVSAIELVDAQAEAKSAKTQVLILEYNGVVKEIMQSLEKASVPIAIVPPDHDPVLTEDMGTQEDLDLLEERCDAFDKYLTSDQAAWDQMTEQQQKEMVTGQMMHQLGTLKRKRTALQAREDENVQEEVQTLTDEILDLGEELSLHGIPCRNGSVILLNFDGDEEEIDQEFPEVELEIDQKPIRSDNHESVEDGHLSTADQEQSYEGAGLFDKVESIEKPNAEIDEDADERELTLAEYNDLMEVVNQSVNNWRPGIPQPEANIDIASVSPSVDITGNELERLRDIEAGEVNFDEEQPLFGTDRATQKLKINAWTRRSQRWWKECQEDTVSKTPDFMLPAEFGAH